MDLAPIERIKRRLLDHEDCTAVSGDFLALFGAVDDSYRRLGQPAEHAFLTALLREIIREAFGAEVRVDEFLSIPEVHLLHAGILFAGIAAGVFYFDDVGIGVVVALDPGGTTTHVLRFEMRHGPPPRFN